MAVLFPIQERSCLVFSLLKPATQGGGNNESFPGLLASPGQRELMARKRLERIQRKRQSAAPRERSKGNMERDEKL